MFTGIIQGLAEVKSIRNVKRNGKSANTRLSLTLRKKVRQDLKIGDSLCINGACLTVTRISKTADFEIIDETMNRTCLGLLKAGDVVNIEKSLKVGERLEGHFLLGHVDGVGVITKVIKARGETKLWIRIHNRKLICSIVSKGSIGIDGVSLTVVDIQGTIISVALIPHTLAVSTLGLKVVGDRVNVETDIIGKYVTHNLPMK
ncbi:MAG TPA: riboflavin synthase [Candidatus Nitrosopolaris sp.]|nr:riboflavin synthase [Candidatus Nitrosopolaris sp.]